MFGIGLGELSVLIILCVILIDQKDLPLIIKEIKILYNKINIYIHLIKENINIILETQEKNDIQEVDKKKDPNKNE